MLAFKILLFLEATAPKEEAGGGWLVCRPLGNLLRKDRLGSELTTGHPVSTLVSASSFSKLFSRLKTFLLAPGSRWGEHRGSWASVAGLLTWDEQPGLPHEVPRELPDAGLPLSSGSSREAALNRLPRLLRLLSSRLLLVGTEVTLEPGGRVSAPEVPFGKESSPLLTPSAGFDGICQTKKRNKRNRCFLVTKC